jgi:hypothetical protein
LALNLNMSTECSLTVTATVVASGPMTASIVYDISGPGSGSVSVTFTAGDLSQTATLATGVDGTVAGTATANAPGGSPSASESWTACVPPPPPS